MKKLRQKFADVFCAVFRHSHLVTNCFGYKSCARCNTQLGDSLAGSGLPVPPYFGVGQLCQCADCRKAFDQLTWVDRFMCPKAEFPTDEYIAKQKQKKDEIMAALRLARNRSA